MSNRSRKLAPIALIATIAVTSLLFANSGRAHFDEDEMAQSYRQSWFAMVAINFGPMVAMLKGEMPWNDEAMKGFADQFAALANMDISRGFAEGTDKGTTRAKPEIWENKADFEQKMADLTTAANGLQSAVAGGNKKEIGKQIGAAGKACKACHDEYKSENYLY